MQRPLVALFLILFCACAACDGGQELSPVAPSEALGSDSELAQDVRSQWSPYVGVHLAGQAVEAYRDAVSTLHAAGRLRGVRVEITRRLHPSDPIIRNISAVGVELLGLISNEYLFAQDIEQDIDDIFTAFPEIRYFQVGNEVTTILPRSGPTIDIDEYMVMFQRIYDHVQNRHPGRAILLTQSTLGSGLHGPMELEAMVNFGLIRMNPNNVIVAINSYDLDNASQYLGLLGGPLRRFRVWVTESGARDPSLHIPWVRDNYPRLRNLLRAERVYWYTMWGGDSGPDTNFSLIKNPGDYPNYWKSPLFELLAGAP